MKVLKLSQGCDCLAVSDMQQKFGSVVFMKYHMKIKWQKSIYVTVDNSNMHKIKVKYETKWVYDMNYVKILKHKQRIFI